jgi:hypothetical protein
MKPTKVHFVALSLALALLAGASDVMAERIETPGISESSNTVNYNIYVFIENPWNRRLARSQQNESIWWGLKEAGIEIAFPQLDVHFDQR